MSNPIDDALEALEQDEMEKDSSFFSPFSFKTPAGAQRQVKPLTPRAQREHQMWQDWDQGGRKPEKLRPLIHSLQPLVTHRSRIFEHKVRDIPPPAIKAEFQTQLVRALETFDPNKGKLATYVGSRLMKANRFVTTYQNPARIVETRVGKITDLKNAEDLLSQQLKRPPTSVELADQMKMPQKDVVALREELRKAHPSGQFGPADPSTITPSRTKEIMRLLPADLSPDENAVFERVYGVSGKRQMGTGSIAKELKMSAPKVSRLKKSIAQKWKEYGG